MFRALVYTVILIFIIAVVRLIMAALRQGVGELFEAERKTGSPSSAARSRPQQSPPGGPLKRDPVCGTYIPTDASVHKVVQGETVYFCSPECRDKYPVPHA